MKKVIITIYILMLVLLSNINKIYAQKPIENSKIYGISRYINNGIEIRWLPEKNSILLLGIKSGYTIERADSGNKKYIEIAKVKAFTIDKWNELILAQKDSNTKSNMEMAMDFMFANPKEYAKPISLEEGIGDLNEQYNKEQMMSAVILKCALNNQKISEALGLGFFDNNIVLGKKYTYKIKIEGKITIYKVEDCFIQAKANKETDKYNTPIFVFPGDKKISFVWENVKGLSGYFVEKSLDENGIYTPLNTNPIYINDLTGENLNGAFSDDTVQNYTPYFYKFYALNNFGEKIIFGRAKGIAKDLTPPRSPFLPQPKHVRTHEVLLNWEKNVIEPDFAGYFVGRCNTDTGQFKIIHDKILPLNTKSYIDTGFNRNGTNFYTVFAFDTAGNVSASLSNYVVMIDSMPPAIPLIENAIIDSNGIVTIKIKNNLIDKDIKGHKLYRANGKDHEYSFVRDFFNDDEEMGTPVKYNLADTISLHSITPNIYYKIKAIDYHYNMSIFSAALIVKRPDTIPPTTPVFTNVEVSDNEIKLIFEPSGSIDVTEHILYKKSNTDTIWNEIALPNSTLKQYIDKEVKSDVLYTYTMRAKDNSNLFSKYAVEVNGKPYIKSIISNVEQLIADTLNGKIVLNWKHNLPKEERKFIIYKQNNSGQMVQYATTDNLYFTDNMAVTENSYSVKVISVKGAQSKLSNSVTIKIKN